MSWPCFLVAPTGESAVALRRYADFERGTCSSMEGSHSYHTASTPIGRLPEIRNERGYVKIDRGVDYYVGDERWPKACECGYEFVDDDRWQVFSDTIWADEGGREFEGVRALPAGAMFESSWMPTGSDGKSWSVCLPPGGGHHVWAIDGPSNSGGRWTRTGVPPRLTVTPSILTGQYHGFLTDGVLTDSLPDRPLS